MLSTYRAWLSTSDHFSRVQQPIQKYPAPRGVFCFLSRSGYILRHMLNIERQPPAPPRPAKQEIPKDADVLEFGEEDIIEEVAEKGDRDKSVEVPTKSEWEWLQESISSLAPPEIGAGLAAKGGEHLVLTFDHRNIVYKVNYFESLPKPQPDLMLPTARKENQKYLEEVKRERREELTELREYFGFSAVPAEVAMVRDLPINHKIIRHLRPWWNVDDDTPLPETFPALVVVQRKLNLDPKNTIPLTGYYLEAPRQPSFIDGSPFTDEQYASIHALLTQEHPERSDEHERHREEIFNAYPNLRTLVERMKGEEGLRDKVRTAARMFVQYTNETGVALDVAGTENALFSYHDGEWSLKIPDVLPPIDTQLESLERVAKKIKAEASLNGNDIVVGLNTMNTIRFINALAFIAEIPDRVHLPAVAHDIPAGEWRRVFQTRWPKSPAKPSKPAEKAA